MTDSELEPLMVVAIDAAAPDADTGRQVRVRYSAAARAEGPNPHWQASRAGSPRGAA